MIQSFQVFFCIASLTAVLSGEVQMQFDGKEWVFPEGVVELTEEVLKDGVCFTADANVPAGIALVGMGFEQLLTHPVRFALRGQEGEGARLDPVLPGKLEAQNRIVVICENGRVMALSLPEDRGRNSLPDNSGRGIMDDDFVGLENFLKIIRDGTKKAEMADEIPRFILVVKSKTSYGHMVRLIQFIRSAGCMSGVIRVHDGPSVMNFDVVSDREIELPVVKVPETEPSGRIVVNIRQDGSLTVGDHLILASEEDVRDYVKQERLRVEVADLKAEE